MPLSSALPRCHPRGTMPTSLPTGTVTPWKRASSVPARSSPVSACVGRPSCGKGWLIS
ncbi:hypothetical protein ACFQY7_42255 [Actinomadura luteofluorescens]|uniref:hypothetical protein n=1 Tax=Actinomadura luteofluorescens TaxID=46163 RepID=UPI00363550B4